ncbi:MAG: MoaD/ThiS family protein [Pyrinomonadaceae bacterium]|jgi:molybdopterin converting factor subunit 1
MNIRLLLFGAVADSIGFRKADIVMPEGATAAELIEKLKEQYPQLAVHKLLIAVNEEYAEATTRLEDGCEAAVFTPVSGG